MMIEPDYTEIRDDRIRSKVCELMSEMLNHPDERGIYPTSRFLWEMETFILAEVKQLREELQKGDYWMERSSVFYGLGGCPVCFMIDDAGHEKSCPWAYDMTRVRRLRAERDNLARALFRIRSLTIRGRGDQQVGTIACDAVLHIDEGPLFPVASPAKAADSTG